MTTETPRTDRFIAGLEPFRRGYVYPLDEFARTLERELAESLARVAELETAITISGMTETSLSSQLQAAHAATEQMREDAAKVCESRVNDEYATGKVDHNEMAWTSWCAGAIRALPLPDGAKVLAERDAEIARLKTHNRVVGNLELSLLKAQLKTRDEELTTAHAAIEAAKVALNEVVDLIGESSGVYGLHLNGDLSPWSELEAGGRFERLTILGDALAQLNALDGSCVNQIKEKP